MGIRFYCPQGHKLNVKEFQAGRRGICPFCGEKILIPTQSTRPSSQEERQARRSGVQAMAAAMAVAATETQAVAEVLPPQHAVENDEVRNVEPALGSLSAGLAGAVAHAGNDNDDVPPAAAMMSPAAAVFAGGSGESRDPLDASAKVVWYVRPPTGGQFGPATPEIIRGWLAEGRISPDTLVWREGWRDWLEAGSVFPQLHLAYVNPLAALKIPDEPLIVPQRAASTSTFVARHTPKNMIWLIAGLGVFTLLAIAGTVYYLTR
jgi:hypothetical protein